jgi:hypothetical protein
MPDDKKQGSIHSSSDGGTVGSYPSPDSSEFLVAPATSGESNALNLNLFLAAYACVTDMRFKFDSSFVLPSVQSEMAAFSSLRKSNPQIMGAPISIFGHADPSFQGNFEVGSSTAQSGDDYNKALSGRRALAIYALLVRDLGLWDTLSSKHLGADVWGQDSIRIMLGQTGAPNPDENTVVNIANNSGQRQQLFLKYMDSLCGDLKLDKSADFLARNAGPDQKGDVQGCSRFNPLLLFSSEDEARFKQAFADKDETTLRGERDPGNAVNRRVMILIFKKGSQVLPAKWPCPSYKDGTGGCIKRFFSDGNTRRSTHTSGAERKFEITQDTFACRFYQRISGEKSPCNSTTPPSPCTVAISPNPVCICGAGKTATVTAAGTPATGSFSWKSSDETIVTVSGTGTTVTVKGLKAGKATLTVSYTTGSCAPCKDSVPVRVCTCTQGRKYAYTMIVKANLGGAKAKIKTRYGKLCCEIEGCSTDAAFHATYANISNNSHGLKWAQVGFSRRRNAGSSAIIQYRKAEIQGEHYFIDMDTANAPSEGSTHEWKCELDKSTGKWSYYDDGTAWKRYTDNFWKTHLGTDVQWTGEILNKEDDMPGTSADKCSFTECQYKVDGGSYADAGITAGDVKTDDSSEWGADRVSGAALDIWDKNPNS